jgi:hypothetical protein
MSRPRDNRARAGSQADPLVMWAHSLIVMSGLAPGSPSGIAGLATRRGRAERSSWPAHDGDQTSHDDEKTAWEWRSKSDRRRRGF